MTETFTAFEGPKKLAAGPAAEVALAVKRAHAAASPVLIFSDQTGRAVDFDLRGSDAEILARLPPPTPAAEPAGTEPRGRGRPKLGVVAREVTLLPRHWEWLNAQPGGASVALRRLVDENRRNSGAQDRERAARDAAYHFMAAMAGDLAHFEDAARALFADDRRRFANLIADWPRDVRDHTILLASSDRLD